MTATAELVDDHCAHVEGHHVYSIGGRTWRCTSCKRYCHPEDCTFVDIIKGSHP
jgi:hypothetical protein